MKIAVPTTADNQVDEHFGHCQAYTIFTTDEDNTIVSSEKMASPQGCGCKSNIALIFKQMQVKTMLAGNMGAGAVNILNLHEVEVYRGCSGDVTEVVKAFLSGHITDSGQNCASHEHHHAQG
ncbi:MAG: NifB/NifX family molybdenum-iron cluster-binding protein [Bacteroidales bacterium]